MKRLLITILAALVLSLPAVAQAPQTFHVTSVHKATDVEKSYKTAFAETLVVGTVGNKQYTLAELNSWGALHFEVGQDYQVIEVKSGNPDTIKLLVHRVYHGKEKDDKETFCIRTIEEVPE